jgi:hypothetical protein
MVTHELSLTGSDREGMFSNLENQGDCVSCVATRGTNESG